MESLTGKQPVGNQQHASVDANCMTRKWRTILQCLGEPSGETLGWACKPHRGPAPPVDLGVEGGVRSAEVAVV
jgi:hypothetical protein